MWHVWTKFNLVSIIRVSMGTVGSNQFIYGIYVVFVSCTDKYNWRSRHRALGNAKAILRFGPFLATWWNIVQCNSFDWVKREPFDRLLFGSRPTEDWQDVVALENFEQKTKLDDRSCKDNFSWQSCTQEAIRNQK